MVDSIRSDARRNRERLLDAAAAAFGAADGRPVSLESIARAAGVGIGTLYRHFPSREPARGGGLPCRARRSGGGGGSAAGMASAKRGLAALDGSLCELRGRKARDGRLVTRDGRVRGVERSQTRAGIVGAVDTLLRAGAEDGSLRADVQADDVVSSLLGIFLASGSPDQMGRMLDLLVAGVAATPAPSWGHAPTSGRYPHPLAGDAPE